MWQSNSRARISPAKSLQLELGHKHKPDYWLLIWCAALLAIGLTVVYAISPALSQANNVNSFYYVSKQLMAIALSIIAFFITYKVPLNWWKQAYKPLLFVAIGATLLALVLPVNPAYPAHRWVRLSSFSFQSVELVKFVVLIWLAGFLASRIRSGTITSVQETFKPLIYILVVIGVIIAGIQSDLGSAAVILAMMGTMAYIAGLPIGKVSLILLILAIVGVLAISISPYRRARLETYLHPQSNCQGSGYQACQALIAVGSGGMAGLGLGSSVQAYGYLPEAANDSIFAIYAEKFGFIGCAILLGIFMAFFNSIKNIAERSTDNFTRLLVIGILAWLSIQTLINVGAMIGLFPLKGITLPFISYGGTSVVFATAAIGLVFQASQYTSYRQSKITYDTDRPKLDYRKSVLRRADY
ncbi:MAG TPA: putative peptidoglycan glycosyltransferase FtsW [Patescibacteria group bacterium]|nr:putative peptidoglycan glycosyltransferase FtsW [Patescibacteria group bacterium]